MTLRIYSRPHSSGTRAVWALEELALPYELALTDSAASKTPDYRAINPNGKVPALVDGDVRLFESVAIIAYLGDTYGVAKGLWPEAPPARAEALSYTVWSVAELLNHGLQYVYHALQTPISYPPEQQSAGAAAYSQSEVNRMLDLLEGRLDGREHIMGGFTLVDVPAADALVLLTHAGLDLGARPKVRAWLERCTARPAFAASHP